MANKTGERFSSCLTPVKQGKYVDILVPVLILDLMLLYNFLIRFRHLSSILYEYDVIFCHRPSRHTVSNACLKSTKAQKNFLDLGFKISMGGLVTKRLSDVEYPLQKKKLFDYQL